MEVILYYIYNTVNSKYYVGISKDINRRYKQHIKGCYTSSTKLGRAIKKYGHDCFEFGILDSFPSYEEAFLKEKEYIRKWNCLDKGYNSTSGGDAGFIFSESSLKKMSEARLGKPLSDEAKRKMSVTNTGRKMSKEFCERVGSFHRGRRRSEETKNKLREAWVKRKARA